MATINPYSSKEFSVSTSDKVAIFSDGSCVISYLAVYSGHPSRWVELARTTAGELYTSSAFSYGTSVRIEAGNSPASYTVGASANVIPDGRVTRSTVTSAATLTAAQHQGLCLYQDASGGAVTMTTLTGTLLAAAFPDMAIGDAIPQYHASNHATNTSTIAGGTDVTLVGSGAVTQTGGQYLLIKTAATTFDLVRVG